MGVGVLDYTNSTTATDSKGPESFAVGAVGPVAELSVDADAFGGAIDHQSFDSRTVERGSERGADGEIAGDIGDVRD